MMMRDPLRSKTLERPRWTMSACAGYDSVGWYRKADGKETLEVSYPRLQSAFI